MAENQEGVGIIAGRCRGETVGDVDSEMIIKHKEMRR
jgi:hypothetical protein